MKNGSRSLWMLCAVATLMACAWSTPPVLGEQSGGIGVVSMTKVTDGFEAHQLARKQLAEFVTEREKKLEQRVMLTELEWAELDELESKTGRTATEEKRLQELTSKSAPMRKEFLALQSKTVKTAAERKRYDMLRRIVEANRRRIDEYKAALQKEVQEKERELIKPLEAKLKAAIEQVAKGRGMSIVLDSSVAVYVSADIDITDEVTKRLNAKPEE